MSESKKPSATMKVVMIVQFHLPGVNYTSSGGMGGKRQLEPEMSEWWRLEVQHTNAAATAAALRDVAAEIERLLSVNRVAT